MIKDLEKKALFEIIAEKIRTSIGGLFHKSLDRKTIEVSSCVFLKYKNNYYAATAYHCIEDVTSSSEIYLITYNNPGPGIRIPLQDICKSRLKRYSRNIDIGYIKLGHKTINELRPNFIENYNSIGTECKESSLVFMEGFPKQLIEIKNIDNSNYRTIHTRPFLFWSNISKRKPNIESILEDKPNPDIDIFIEYNEKNIHEVKNDTNIEINPSGMSGCGVFELPLTKTNKIFNVSDLKLIGIQSKYKRKDNLLIGVKIENLFELIDSELT